MLFYFQFLATPRTEAGESPGESMVAHVLVDSVGVEPAAEEVVRLMSSVNVDISDVRRACPIRRLEDLSVYRNMGALYAEAEQTGHAILLEMLRGGELLSVPVRRIPAVSAAREPGR